MKKTAIKILSAYVAAAVLAATAAGCGGQTNSLPEVDGAHDIDCIVDTTADLPDGVAALDYEDGDITPDMQITVTPEARVENGYAVFPEEGEYSVTYSVEDSSGGVAEDTVLVNAIEREKYTDFRTVGGFSASVQGSASLTQNGMYDGVYIVEAGGATVAEDIALTRTYTLDNGYNYTFTYNYNSSAAGRAYVLADGARAAEVSVSEGDGSLTFTYIPRGEGSTSEVEISLLLGNLGSVRFNLKGATFMRPRGTETEDLTENFTFNGRVEPRFDGTSGNAFAGEGGSTAVLEMRSVSEEDPNGIWRGGMFINTGIVTEAGQQYELSFDISAINDSPFEVVVQRDKFNETKYHTESISGATTAQHKVVSFTPTAENAGDLYLYVQSGNAVNDITMRNLAITVVRTGDKAENIELKDFVLSDSEGRGSTMTTAGGGFTLNIPSFADTDWEQQVTSPEFYLSGSGENYIITFRAKATASVTCVFAAPLYGGWDPTLAWQRITITEEEQVFSVWCSDAGGNRYNNFVWQFGAVSNQRLSDVTIEITDIEVCYKNNTLD